MFSNREEVPVPQHVGIIMDGNGRWAKKRSMARSAGHKEGLETAKKIILEAEALGVRYLSLYVFSTENWKRAIDEVSLLMGLLRNHLRGEFDFYRKNRIRVLHSGDPAQLSKDIQKDLIKVIQDTASFDGITLNLAINYGGRNEILRAVEKMNHAHPLRKPRKIKEDFFRHYLDNPEMPDMDLLIRTGGDYRISNFFLWTSAYAELYFDDKLWPDWTKDDLRRALLNYQHRERRFGGVLHE